MAKALEAARLPIEVGQVAGQLIPGLLTEYLKYCGIEEFAPIEVGGPHQPHAKITGLFRVIYEAHKEREQPADETLREALKSSEGAVAKATAVGALVDARNERRFFRALLSGDPDKGATQVSLVSTCTSAGEWSGCPPPLKLSGLEKLNPGIAAPLAARDAPAVRAAGREQEQRRPIEENGEICQPGPETDEHLHYPDRRRVPGDPGAQVAQAVARRSVFNILRRRGQIQMDS